MSDAVEELRKGSILLKEVMNQAIELGDLSYGKGYMSEGIEISLSGNTSPQAFLHDLLDKYNWDMTEFFSYAADPHKDLINHCDYSEDICNELPPLSSVELTARVQEAVDKFERLSFDLNQ